MKKTSLNTPREPAKRRLSQHADMRRKNESIVLMLVRKNRGLSGAELARQSGLAPQTISVLLKNLEKKGLVRRGEVLRGKRGQPATPILIEREAGFGIGVEIGWRHSDVVLLNLLGEVVAADHVEYAYPKADRLVGDVSSQIEQVLKAVPSRLTNRIAGLGLALPSDMSSHLPHVGASHPEAVALRHLDIAGSLGDRLRFPIHLINDGTAACRSECTYGRGADYGDMVYLYLSSFVGSGIFVDGRIVEGFSGDAANLGSFLVRQPVGDYRTLHKVASVTALEVHLAKAGYDVHRATPGEWNWSSILPLADEWIEDAARGLAHAIVSSCTVIGFSAAIIDGTLPSPILSKIVERTQAAIGELPAVSVKPPVVIQGTIGSHAPAIGAADVPIHNRYFA